MVARNIAFLSDTFSFRNSMTVRGILVTFGISLCLFAFTIVMYEQPILAAVSFVPALVLAVLCVNWSWHYFRDLKESVVIDVAGVQIGGESWTWNRLKALRVFLGPHGYQILIWPDRDRGVGRVVPIDHPLNAEDAQQLLNELQSFVSEREISCDIGEYSRDR